MPTITTDAFIGHRVSVERSLVCAMAGQFPVLARGPGDELVVVFRSGAGHYGLPGTLATARSHDGGRTWGDPRELAPRGHDVRNPALAVIGTRWVVAYWQAGLRCYRDGLWVLPAGALVLVLTFGRRQRPLGCGALVSHDDGATWATDREVVLAGDGVGNDVGYPSTVQLDDGTLATALYFARGSGVAAWSETSCQLLRYPPTLVGAARR